MFYSYDLLSLRKKGRYSVIWTAATYRRCSRKVDILKVNIEATCEELLEAIKMPPKRKNASKRLSLYMAAMLMHGTCIVYREQVLWLLRENTNFMENFLRLASAKIVQGIKELSRDEADTDEPPKEKRRKVVRKKKEPELPLPPPPPELQAAPMADVPALDEATVQQNVVDAHVPATPKTMFIDSREDPVRSRGLQELDEHLQQQGELFNLPDPYILAEMIGAAEDIFPALVAEAQREKLVEPPLPSVPAPADAGASPPLPPPELPSPPAGMAAEMITVAPAEVQAEVPAEKLAETPVEEKAEVKPIVKQEVPTEVEAETPAKVPAEALEVPAIHVESATPKRPSTTPIRRAVPEKRPRVLRLLGVFQEDEDARISKDTLKTFKFVLRVDSPGDDVASLADAEREEASDSFARLRRLRRQQEYVRADTERLLEAEASAEIALGASRLTSISHLSHLSEVGEDVNKIQGQLIAIPEFPDASRISAVQPLAGEEVPLPAPEMQPEFPQDVPMGASPPLPEEELPLAFRLRPTEPPGVRGLEAAPATAPAADVPDQVLPLGAAEAAPVEAAAVVPMDVTETALQPMDGQETALQPMDVTETALQPMDAPVLDRVAPEELSPRTNWELTRHTILEKLNELWLEENGETTFEKLCPHTMPRVKAALTFNILLHLDKDAVLYLQQDTTRSYGTISILEQ